MIWIALDHYIYRGERPIEHADPSVKRKSGFLMPQPSTSDTLGYSTIARLGGFKPEYEHHDFDVVMDSGAYTDNSPVVCAKLANRCFALASRDGAGSGRTHLQHGAEHRQLRGRHAGVGVLAHAPGQPDDGEP